MTVHGRSFYGLTRRGRSWEEVKKPGPARKVTAGPCYGTGKVRPQEGPRPAPAPSPPVEEQVPGLPDDPLLPSATATRSWNPTKHLLEGLPGSSPVLKQ